MILPSEWCMILFLTIPTPQRATLILMWEPVALRLSLDMLLVMSTTYLVEVGVGS